VIFNAPCKHVPHIKEGLYWRYVTQGVVDITPVISQQAPFCGGLAVPQNDHHASMENLTPTVTGVTTSVSAQGLTGQEDATQRVMPDPPRAGRSRLGSVSAYIPAGPSWSSPKKDWSKADSRGTAWSHLADGCYGIRGMICSACQPQIIYDCKEDPFGPC
jgi:hypothetical protein